MDCRLARALAAWAPTLREAGIVAIEHYSMYRKGARVAGSTKRSGHAVGMAIDAGRFELADGSVIDVLHDWTDRKRGADPCKKRLRQPRPAKLMRSVVCRAAELNLFQTIVTPHHNDAHRNHVHLEVAGAGAPQWIR